MRRPLCLSLGLLALGLAAPAAAQATTYLCSGTSEEERALAETTPHSLKLVYAQPGGSFLGDVTTRIAEPGGQVVVEARCEGPWLLVDLPAGDYEVTASYRGESKSLRVSVSPGPQEQVVTF